jgi:hypothetical protein
MKSYLKDEPLIVTSIRLPKKIVEKVNNNNINLSKLCRILLEDHMKKYRMVKSENKNKKK